MNKAQQQAQEEAEAAATRRAIENEEPVPAPIGAAQSPNPVKITVTQRTISAQVTRTINFQGVKFEESETLIIEGGTGREKFEAYTRQKEKLWARVAAEAAQAVSMFGDV